jgi:hypothetical protein
MTTTDDASADLFEFVDRHLRRNGGWYVGANEYASDLIDLIQRRGPRNDWTRENDLINLIPSTEEIKTIPLTGLSWEGNWSVSNSFSSSRESILTQICSSKRSLEKEVMAVQSCTSSMIRLERFCR